MNAKDVFLEGLMGYSLILALIFSLSNYYLFAGISLVLLLFFFLIKRFA